MSQYYPPLEEDSLWAFQVILEHLQTDPDYLDDESCPYPQALKDLLRTARKRSVSEIEDDIDLESEAHSLFLELRESKEHLTVDDNAERMSYFRTATSLLDKLIGMRERANNVKKVSTFYSTVLGIMEEILEPDQVTKVRNRLNDFL